MPALRCKNCYDHIDSSSSTVLFVAVCTKVVPDEEPKKVLFEAPVCCPCVEVIPRYERSAVGDSFDHGLTFLRATRDPTHTEGYRRVLEGFSTSWEIVRRNLDQLACYFGEEWPPQC